MIILDTDVVSELMRPSPAAALIARLTDVPAAEQYTTAVTVGELVYGAARVGRPELYERAKELLRGATVLAFDLEAAERYGQVRDHLERQGTRLSDSDLRIAATAIARRGTLITGHPRHFGRVPDLKVDDWLRG